MSAHDGFEIHPGVLAAAAWLEGRAVEHSLIVAVTHASFRRQLADRLLRTGWQTEQRHRSTQHWSAWLFRRSG